MVLGIERGAFLLLICAVVAILTRRLRLPYSVGLVVAGIALALLPRPTEVALTKELLFAALLPPLIFEAAFNLDWARLRRDLPVSLLLATLGVLLSAALTAVGMHYLAAWSWIAALIFGVLIAATDPVSVIATFKESGVQGRLLVLIESESLFNDGTAAVLFALVLQFALGRPPTPVHVSLGLLLTVGGSILCGALVAGLTLALAVRSQDHLVEIAVTTVAAYGSFLFAEHFQFSGVLATLTAGLMMGNIGTFGALTERGREAVLAFWEYAAFIANSFVFLLIGMREAHQSFRLGWAALFAAILVVAAARAAAVYPCCALFARTRLHVSARHQHVLFWGGLRGALALALALALPAGIPQRDSIVAASFAVVAFSVFVQGLTLTPLLRRFGELPVASVQEMAKKEPASGFRRRA